MDLKKSSTTKKQWDRLIAKGQTLSFKKGQVLFYEGHHPYGIFLLQSGEVKFTKQDTPCLREHFFSLPQGKVIGLKPFLEGRAYSCTCTALMDCRMLFIPKSEWK